VNPIQKNVDHVIANQVWPKVTDKRVLVTGGTGLLGIHIADFFSQLGADVTSIFHTEPSKFFWGMLPVVDMVQYDLSVDTIGSPGRHLYDYIIHAAGYAQPKKFIADPMSTIAINTAATSNLFQLLAPGGKFLFISSDAVYTGCSDDPPYGEYSYGTSNPNNPRSAYIESKRIGELITKYNGGVIARASYIYGPGCKIDDGRVVNELIVKALTQKELVLSDGRDERSWLYVSDGIQMLLNILFGGEYGEVYNVANIKANSESIYDLANTIAILTRVPLLVHDNKSNITGPPKEHSLSIDKYVKRFGEKHFTPILSGLRSTIEWYRLMLDHSRQNSIM
jgi:UDP-glucuronate decarboxylase